MAIVERLADAQVGDEAYIYYAEHSRYVDGKYDGRGVWEPVKITGLTRQSVLIGFKKFDRVTGVARPERGFRSNDTVAGSSDRKDLAIFDQRYALTKRVEAEKSVEILLKVAEIVGFSLKSS